MIKKELKHTQALVISSTAFKEDSAIITLAGDEGLFSILARGVYKVKSPLKPLLISGNFLSLDYTKGDKDFGFAQSLSVVSDASDLMMNYSHSCFLLYLQEISLALYRYGDAYPYLEIDSLIKKLISGADLLSLTLLLLGTFYKNLGISVNTSSCIHCGKKKNIVSFSLTEGGYLCNDCSSQFKVGTVETMDLYVLKFAFSDLNEEILNKVVPVHSGIRVLSELNDNLLSYFDLKPLKTFSLFIQSLN